MGKIVSAALCALALFVGATSEVRAQIAITNAATNTITVGGTSWQSF